VVSSDYTRVDGDLQQHRTSKGNRATTREFRGNSTPMPPRTHPFPPRKTCLASLLANEAGTRGSPCNSTGCSGVLPAEALHTGPRGGFHDVSTPALTPRGQAAAGVLAGSKKRRSLDLCLAVWASWHNYVRLHFHRDQQSPAQGLGFVERRMTQEQLLSWRQDWRKESLRPLARGSRSIWQYEARRQAA